MPFSAFYTLTLAGASGGNASQHGGHGAVLSGILKLNKGTRLRILICQRGVKGTMAAGGGGGTFVTPTHGKRKFLGEGGLKRRQFPRGWGVPYRVFFPGGLSKISELLINKRFSVEEAFSYFTVTGLQSKFYCLD